MADRVLTSEQYDRTVSMLADSRAIRESAKDARLSLAEKLALQRQAGDLRAEALAIGEPTAS